MFTDLSAVCDGVGLLGAEVRQDVHGLPLTGVMNSWTPFEGKKRRKNSQTFELYFTQQVNTNYSPPALMLFMPHVKHSVRPQCMKGALQTSSPYFNVHRLNNNSSVTECIHQTALNAEGTSEPKFKSPVTSSQGRTRSS